MLSASAACDGGGVTRRTRNLTEPAYGGDPCPTDPGTVDLHECNTQACPQDCVSSFWMLQITAIRFIRVTMK